MPTRKRKYCDWLNPDDEQELTKIPRTTAWRIHFAQKNDLGFGGGNQAVEIELSDRENGNPGQGEDSSDAGEQELNVSAAEDGEPDSGDSDSDQSESDVLEHESEAEDGEEEPESGDSDSDQSESDFQVDNESDVAETESQVNNYSNQSESSQLNVSFGRTEPLQNENNTFNQRSDEDFNRDSHDNSSHTSPSNSNDEFHENLPHDTPEINTHHNHSEDEGSSYDRDSISINSTSTSNDFQDIQAEVINNEASEDESVNGVSEEEDQDNDANFPVMPPAINVGQEEVMSLPNNEFSNLKQMLKGKFSETITVLPKISGAQLFLNSLNLIKLYKLNHSQAEGIMMLVNSIFQENILPPSRHLLDKLVKSSCGAHYHFVCNKCKHYFGEKNYELIQSVKCEVCDTVNKISDLSNSTFFVIFDVPVQVEVLFNDEKIRSKLKNPLDLVNNDNNGLIKDIYDGTMYQKFASKLQPGDMFRHISFCMSVDGSPLFKTNSKEIWPIFLSILELDPGVRGHHLLLGGIWFGSKHPIMDIFLPPFIEHMNALSLNGFQIHVENVVWHMKAHLLCCCADAPARAAVQFVHQHNGFAGCNWCLHPGEWVDGKRKYFILDHLPQLRSAAELRRDGLAALDKKGPKKDRHVNGVTGLSPFLASVSMDAVNGLILDFMHHADHGIGYQIPASWLGEHGAAVEYYIGSPDNLRKMTELIKSLRLPIEARRPARDIKEFAEYQARDHQNFNLLFGVPILMEIENQKFKKYLNHWILFVQACHILLQKELTREDVNLAHVLLTQFVTTTEEVYGEEGGKEHMTYNMHITFHVAENAARWGQPWGLNAYWSEAGNKTLKGDIASGRGIASQVCRALSKSCAIQLLEVTCGSSETDKFYHSIKKDHVERCIYVGDDRYLGVQTSFVPTPAERWLCARREIDTSSFVQVEKLVHLNCVYAPDKCNIQTNNSVAFLKPESYVYIEKIIVSEEKCEGYLIVKKIHSTPTMTPPGVPSDHAFLRKISFIEGDPIIISPEDLDIICARLTLPKDDYIVKLPNIYNTC